MFNKIMVGACVIGGIVMSMLMCALVLGMNYLDLFGFTIIQIFYILGLTVTFIVHFVYSYVKCKKQERVKVPIIVDDYDEDEY